MKVPEERIKPCPQTDDLTFFVYSTNELLYQGTESCNSGVVSCRSITYHALAFLQIKLLTSANLWRLALRRLGEEVDIIVLPITLHHCISAKIYLKKAPAVGPGHFSNLLQEVASSLVACTAWSSLTAPVLSLCTLPPLSDIFFSGQL